MERSLPGHEHACAINVLIYHIKIADRHGPALAIRSVRPCAPERFALPQVASSPAILPVRPELPGRPAAASDESSESFGGMLDASSGPDAPGTSGTNSVPPSDSAAPAKPQAGTADTPSIPAKTAGILAASMN